jgi:predicted NBD/HSP70 family sugar kinase
MRQAIEVRGPLDQRGVRIHNLGLVMRHIARQGPRSRVRIAAETGLNKATVSSLVAELIDRGLLVEAAPTNLGAVGRPAREVRLAGDGIAGVGLEIGEHHLLACAVDLTGVVRFQKVTSEDSRGSDPNEVVARLGALAADALSALDEQQLAPVGVTVALPGLVDISRGVLFVAPNLGWNEVPVADTLRERIGPVGFPIRADNDANLGALRELWEGAGRRLRDFVYLYGEIGAGIGGGLVLRGELYRGPSGFGGELGHMQLARRGPRCRCGNTGCLETLAGWDALRRLAGLGPYEPGEGRDEDARHTLAARARAGDRPTLRALAEVARWLATGLVSVVNAFSPQAVVLGGYYAELAEWLVPAVERGLAQHVLGARWASSPVLVSDLGEEAPVRGAAALSLHEVLSNPTVIERRAPVSLSAGPAPA